MTSPRLSASVAVGVGHPPEALPEVRRTDPRSWEIHNPEGVATPFHVSVYKIEPAEAVWTRNLFTKDDWRARDADEVEPVRPEVPLVSKPKALACAAERLARAGAGPDWGGVVGVSGEAQGVGPAPQAGKEMRVDESSEVVRSNMLDWPGVDFAIRQLALLDQVPQPERAVLVDFVVVGPAPGHQTRGAMMRCRTTLSGAQPARLAAFLAAWAAKSIGSPETFIVT